MLDVHVVLSVSACGWQPVWMCLTHMCAENVWGTWNGITPRDGILSFLCSFLCLLVNSLVTYTTKDDTHTLTHSLSIVLVVVMNSKKLKTLRSILMLIL